MSKTKKHIQTEKERLHQEEAARLRAEKAAKQKRDQRKTAFLLLGLALLMLAIMAVLAGLNIARMRNYELNYTRTYGTVTGIRTQIRAGHKNKKHYYLVYSYTVDGETYSATDWESDTAYRDDLIGARIEIYVDPSNPERAARVVTADGFSVFSVFPFVLGSILYVVGMATLLAAKGSSFKKRAVAIWLPLIGLCAACVLLFWLGLPHDGLSAVYARVRGAVGFTVVAGLLVVVAVVDGLLARKGKR